MSSTTSHRTACTHPRRRLPPGHPPPRPSPPRRTRSRGMDSWSSRRKMAPVSSLRCASTPRWPRVTATWTDSWRRRRRRAFGWIPTSSGSRSCAAALGGGVDSTSPPSEGGAGTAVRSPTAARSPSHRGPIPPRTTSRRPRPRRMRGTGYVAWRTLGSLPRSSDRVSWSRTTGLMVRRLASPRLGASRRCRPRPSSTSTPTGGSGAS
mmetsp:Transcript_11366/g.44172  ORF Transcript_11366/g.44172 Transcript_11366/m.44172 type:complete len:207 (+) Transcript_11366:545-1165(+)